MEDIKIVEEEVDGKAVKKVEITSTKTNTRKVDASVYAKQLERQKDTLQKRLVEIEANIAKLKE